MCQRFLKIVSLQSLFMGQFHSKFFSKNIDFSFWGKQYIVSSNCTFLLKFLVQSDFTNFLTFLRILEHCDMYNIYLVFTVDK